MNAKKSHEECLPEEHHLQTPRRQEFLPRRSFFSRLLALALVAAALPGVMAAGSAGIGGKKSVEVFVSNVYVGGSVERLLTVNPADLPAVIAASSQTLAEIIYSDPPARMAALAAEIAERQPDVVSLMELSLLQIQPPGSGEFVTVLDTRELLLEALAAEGVHYSVAVLAPQTDLTVPVLYQGIPMLARLVDHDAILVRSDLPPGQLRYTNPQTGQFVNRIVIPGQSIEVVRGWCSVDLTIRGEQFRVICSHLETGAAGPLQYLQAMELLAGPANTELPVLLTGDFNTDPLGRDGTSTYPLFAAAGFNDAWLAVNPQDPAGGLTWGHDPLLSNPLVTFDRRIDLVLYRGAVFHPSVIEVVDPLISTLPPLWFSDHAAVSATLNLGNPKAFKSPGQGKQ